MKRYPSCLRSGGVVIGFRIVVFAFSFFVFAFRLLAANPHGHWLFVLFVAFYLLLTFLLQRRACGYQS